MDTSTDTHPVAALPVSGPGQHEPALNASVTVIALAGPPGTAQSTRRVACGWCGGEYNPDQNRVCQHRAQAEARQTRQGAA